MNKHDAAKICQGAKKGSRITLKDGCQGTVIESSPESGCIWVFPDGGPYDVRVWASQVQSST